MTRTMKNPISPIRRNGGFTLIEMLVVAALIAIFAGLAVFNIVEQLNREKEKAAIAEARSIATAMSFAYDDLGFYPRLCWLKFGQEEFLKYIADRGGLPGSAVDWFGQGDASMLNRINTSWGEKYMAGGMPDKFVTMRIETPGGIVEENWPSDPFNQPYMAYLVKIERPANQPGAPPEIVWADDKVGDKPNYFAGIVSYGRNKVPGYAWNDPNAFNNGAARRLFRDVTGFPRMFSTSNVLYTQDALDALVESVPNPVTNPPWTGLPPNIRDAGSDDKYFEF